MIDTSSKRVAFYHVKSRDADTLIPLVRQTCQPNTMIHSDGWAAYNRLSPEFQHETVIHEKNFVDPDTGCHTQTIESTWKQVKTFVTKQGAQTPEQKLKKANENEFKKIVEGMFKDSKTKYS